MITDTLRPRLKSLASITDLVGSGDNARIFDEYQKQDAALPHIVFEVFEGFSTEHLGGITGIAENRIQISCFGVTQLAANDLADLVRRALQGFRGTIDGQKINGITSASGFEHGHDRPKVTGSTNYRFWTSRDFNVAYTESSTQLTS